MLGGGRPISPHRPSRPARYEARRAGMGLLRRAGARRGGYRRGRGYNPRPGYSAVGMKVPTMHMDARAATPCLAWRWIASLRGTSDVLRVGRQPAEEDREAAPARA